MIDKYFPIVAVISSKNDKEWITPKIKTLIAERQKAHHNKNFYVRDTLARNVRQEIKKAKVNYNESKSEKFTSSNSKEWYNHLSKIINNGKRDNIIFNNVPELVGKTTDEITDIVNNHFAEICQSYPPIDESKVINVDPDEMEIKSITEVETSKLIRKFSKRALGAGDFPQKIYRNLQKSLQCPSVILQNVH